MRNNSGQLISDEIVADTRISTAGLRKSYWMLSSTELIGNFNRISGWLPVNAYADSKRALQSEEGSYDRIRVLVTGIHNTANIVASSSKDGYDVYNNYVLAKEAYAHITQEAAGPQYIYRDPLIAGGELALFGTVGYTTSFTGKVLNDLWCAKVRCTRLN